MDEPHPLCTAAARGGILAANEHAVAIFDAFPVSPGHALILSKRHVAELFELSLDEQRAIWLLLPDVKQVIESRHSPAGYNIGANVGSAAGQTVAHVHVHVIPRYEGDVDDPRGGVRWVFPARAERVSLEPVRRPLLAMQDDFCFYCSHPIAGRAEVDHFIPWTRYPDDGLDNLVVAHPRCNNSKRDFLAGALHVERWRLRAKEHAGALATVAAERSWHRDAERTSGAESCLRWRRSRFSGTDCSVPETLSRSDRFRVRLNPSFLLPRLHGAGPSGAYARNRLSGCVTKGHETGGGNGTGPAQAAAAALPMSKQRPVLLQYPSSRHLT